ncbi:tRNA-modifying protein YgfZ [Vibrio mediterranei]|uniref:tRNA-modifying protein YgfZ n=1 Tax=Vibrio mediterranei TaxID=689 RepID=UPI004069765B
MDWQPSIQAVDITPGTPLPELLFTQLTSWGAIEMTGDDRKSYLQGQVTCDVVSLEQDQSTLGAHCDAKGKVWSIFRLCHTDSGYAMIQPASAIDKELAEIKKYAVFSKVDINVSKKPLIGVVGRQCQLWIDEQFPTQGDVRQHQGSTAIRINSERWMLLADEGLITTLRTDQSTPWLPDSLWTKLDIEQGLPILEAEHQNQYIPQAFNLQALDGISFSKGCYTGQETVARAKYRGINKRMLANVRGQLNVMLTDDTKVEVERSVGENWRKAGDVLAQYQYANGEFVAAIVIANNLDADTQFRVSTQPDCRLQLEQPPYPLDDE